MLSNTSAPGLCEFFDRIAQIQALLPELFVVPGILADRDGRLAAPHWMQGLLCRRNEPARLVEDVIGRQQHLVLPERLRPAFDHRRAICGSLACVACRAADVSANHDCIQTGGFRSQAVRALPACARESYPSRRNLGADSL